jgi:hypothetical protein
MIFFHCKNFYGFIIIEKAAVVKVDTLATKKSKANEEFKKVFFANIPKSFHDTTIPELKKIPEQLAILEGVCQSKLK